MGLPNRASGMDDRQSITQGSERAPVDGSGGGGHPPVMDDLTRRVDRLETILDQMAPTLARIDERLKYLATKEDVAKVGERVAKVEGAVEKLPTTLHLLGFIVSVLALAGIAKFLHL